MFDFSLYQKVKVVYGPGSSSKIGELVREANYSNAFVVFDEGIKASGIIDKILQSLKGSGVIYTCYDKVMPNPADDMIEEASLICNREKCDVVIGVGGGSSIDAAKGINILRFNEAPMLRYADFINVEMKVSPGLISIPTTAGTGSELSDGLIVTDHKSGDKIPVLAVNGMSEYAVIDPELMIGMPLGLTVMTGLDALCHACESYITIRSNQMKDQIAEKAIELVYQWLPLALEDGKNIEARSHMAIAASMGGWMLREANALAGHSFGHVLGAKYHIPHGAACTYAEPYILEYNADVVPEKIKKIGMGLGVKFTGKESSEEIGALTKDAFISFYQRLGLKPIKEYNCDLSTLPEVANLIKDEPFMYFNMKQMEYDEIMTILNKIYA